MLFSSNVLEIFLKDRKRFSLKTGIFKAGFSAENCLADVAGGLYCMVRTRSLEAHKNEPGVRAGQLGQLSTNPGGRASSMCSMFGNISLGFSEKNGDLETSMSGS